MKPVTKETLKARIDDLPLERLQLVEEFLSGLQVPEPAAWTAFIEETYGSMADAPIAREPEGLQEVRARLE